MTLTANSDFVSETLRAARWMGGTESRGKELGLCGMKGVGSNAKCAAPMSDGWIQAAMKQAHGDAQYHPRTAVDAENRLLAYPGSVFSEWGHRPMHSSSPLEEAKVKKLPRLEELC